MSINPPSIPKKWRWGILGAGSIAGTFAEALAACETGRFVSIGSRDHKKATDFAAKYGGERGFGSYEEVLLDPDVEVVYIALPHPMHAEWSLRAAAAGKHILCEKPLAMSASEARQIIGAAQKHNVFLMEAFMSKCHPQIPKLVELIQMDWIGKVGVIHATFSFRTPFRADSRLFAKELGGGGILDVGCYTTMISRLIAGAANEKPFCEPKSLVGRATIHSELGTDLAAVAVADFEGDILAQLSCGIGLKQDLGVTIYGTDGKIFLPNPYAPSRDGGESEIHTFNSNGDLNIITVPSPKPLYALEADVVGRALSAGLKETAEMSWQDTEGNMEALDTWRKTAGIC